MRGIDTNILVRYLAQDDPEQSALANDVFEGATASNRIFISTIVMLETIWVLKSIYAASLETIGKALSGLCESPRIHLQDQDLFKALVDEGFDKHYRDRLIAESAKQHGCDCLLTLDKRLAKQCEGVTLLT
jgi:predicted nucleic-acid-binding protein